MTSEGVLVVYDESDETTVVIDWSRARCSTLWRLCEEDDGIKEPYSEQITLLKEVPTWKERCLGEAMEWHGGLAEKISLWRGDITALLVDVVVNAAKSSLLGGGVDGAIHIVAGPGLRDECATLNGCSVGEAKITCAHGLPVKHVIHTVGPRSGDEALSYCYQSSLSICEERHLQSIAFPCISTCHFGFTKE